jgi:hypothetical protein
MISNTRNRMRIAIIASIMLAALAFLSTLVTGTWAATDESTDEAQSLTVFPPAQSPAEADDRLAAFREQFALLRTPAAASIPAKAVIVDPGVDRASAREIVPASTARLAAAGARSPQERLWVAARDDGTQCLLALSEEADGPAQVCATPEQAVAGYFLMTTGWSRSRVAIYGLVPDGVEAVTVALRDGTSVVLPVEANAYAAELDVPTQSVSFTDGAGAKHELNAGVDV